MLLWGEGGANLEYSMGWGGVGNADQNSRTSEQTFQDRIHSTRIWGPDTLMPISRVSQPSFPALQVLDAICLKQSISVRIYGRVPFLSVRQSGWGQGSLFLILPSALPSSLARFPLTTEPGAAAPGLATLQMILAQRWELGDRAQEGLPGKPGSRAATLGVAGVNSCFSPFLVFQRWRG